MRDVIRIFYPNGSRLSRPDPRSPIDSRRRALRLGLVEDARLSVSKERLASRARRSGSHPGLVGDDRRSTFDARVRSVAAIERALTSRSSPRIALGLTRRGSSLKMTTVGNRVIVRDAAFGVKQRRSGSFT